MDFDISMDGEPIILLGPPEDILLGKSEQEA